MRKEEGSGERVRVGAGAGYEGGGSGGEGRLRRSGEGVRGLETERSGLVRGRPGASYGSSREILNGLEVGAESVGTRGELDASGDYRERRRVSWLEDRRRGGCGERGVVEVRGLQGTLVSENGGEGGGKCMTRGRVCCVVEAGAGEVYRGPPGGLRSTRAGAPLHVLEVTEREEGVVRRGPCGGIGNGGRGGGPAPSSVGSLRSVRIGGETERRGAESHD
ncbi:hypothetical protein WJX77_001702 [Trebouxia sp. C0004]